MANPKYAPGLVRIRYTGVNRPHTQIFGIKFEAGSPEPGVDPALESTANITVSFTDGVTEFVTAQLKCFSPETTFGFADIYAVDPDTGFRQFIYTTNLALVGTGTDPQIAKSEGVYVFKTTNGKPLKIYQMEGVWAFDSRNIGVVPDDGRQDVLDYVLGDSNILYGLSNAFPLAFMSFTSKENDVLRRQQMPTV